MKRPYVILNAAMTLDGKIATISGDSKISSRSDLIRLHKLRAYVDAVMVGAGTILADDPSLTVRLVNGKNPMRVVVDGKARIPPEAKILDSSAETIVVVSSKLKKRKIDTLMKSGANVMKFRGVKVNLNLLLKKLYFQGVRKLLLEGGSTLNWGMLEHNLVDEVQVTVAPKLVGGEKTKTLIGGLGFSRIKESTKLKLLDMSKNGSELLLRYRVVGAKRD